MTRTLFVVGQYLMIIFAFKQMKRDPKRMMSQLQNAIDPGMLQQMGGMGNLMNMVGQMQNGEGGEGMGQMMEQV